MNENKIFMPKQLFSEGISLEVYNKLLNAHKLIGDYSIFGDGTAYSMIRTNTPTTCIELSDDEIEKAGLKGVVRPASDKANRLHSFESNCHL